jgi:hypothetical protein
LWFSGCHDILTVGDGRSHNVPCVRANRRFVWSETSGDDEIKAKFQYVPILRCEDVVYVHLDGDTSPLLPSSRYATTWSIATTLHRVRKDIGKLCLESQLFFKTADAFQFWDRYTSLHLLVARFMDVMVPVRFHGTVPSVPFSSISVQDFDFA